MRPEVEALGATTHPTKAPQRGFRTTFETIRPRLKLVESFISKHVHHGPPPVQEAASYVLDAGGKRLRPALLLVAARALG
jgi:octaprenyl-diphosphate synthase